MGRIVGTTRRPAGAVVSQYPAASSQWAARDGSTFEVSVHVGMVDGRLRCTGLHISPVDGSHITTELVRELAIGEFVRAAADQLGLGNDVPLPPADFALSGMTRESLQAVAAVHRWCMETGRAPFGVLERDYGIPRAKASRWISRALHAEQP